MSKLGDLTGYSEIHDCLIVKDRFEIDFCEISVLVNAQDDFSVFDWIVNNRLKLSKPVSIDISKNLEKLLNFSIDQPDEMKSLFDVFKNWVSFRNSACNFKLLIFHTFHKLHKTLFL